MLGFRRLFRIGAREHPSEDQPLVVGAQFNPAGMWQRVERLTDSFAQALGLWLIVVGAEFPLVEPSRFPGIRPT
jgi:hypothetical protein